MKIAFIGNMNNNNYAMLRYFRDLGVDATLILFKNDGVGPNKHFSPEADTWNIANWNMYIHRSEIFEDIVSTLNFPWSWILTIRSFIRALIHKDKHFAKPCSTKYIKKIFKNFDVLIGSGVCPALLGRAGLTLDIFYPYAIGVEYLEDTTFTIGKNKILGNFFYKKITSNQLKGIKNAKLVLCSEFGVTKTVLSKHNIISHVLAIPMVYNKEIRVGIRCDYSNLETKISNSNFIMLSHVRHIWNKPDNETEESWRNQNKHNDWIIKAYCKFLKKINPNALLILFQYGDDVASSQKLIQTLNIEENVIWLPKLDRKYIYDIIDKIHIGIGEFYEVNTIWGSSLLELLSRGKAVIHGYNFENNIYESFNGHPRPPFLIANSIDQIYERMVLLYENPEIRKSIGLQATRWFDNFSGINLARKIISKLNELYHPNRISRF